MKSINFGKIQKIKVDINRLKVGDLITVYTPDKDYVNIYQHQGNGCYSCKYLPSPSEVYTCGGYDYYQVHALIENSNVGIGKSFVIKTPKSIAPSILANIPNPHLRVRGVETPNWIK